MSQINPTKITVPFKTLDKIIHLADIHVRLLKRHAEYREAFAQLYDDLKMYRSTFSNSIIVVAGDLVHAKIDLSPEMVALVSDFLRKLADIAPTFVIVGNHDLNLANSFRLDSLTPIIENIAHPDLYYLRNSGVYTVADTDLTVMSILDEQDTWPAAPQSTAAHKVALCHAPVNLAQTDTGFTISNRHLEVSKFDGFHMVLLGDIHKHQVLQEYNENQNLPIVAYAGSLIQQNHGEPLKGHGWLEWNVPQRSFTFHELNNEYGYVTLIIENGKVPDLSQIPPNVRLRVFVKDIEPSKVKKIQSILQKRFTLQEFTINKLRDDSAFTDANAKNAPLADVHDVNVQNKLIEDFIFRHHAIVDEEMLARILEINKRLNGLVPAEETVRNVQWKPKKFTFDNMYSYGEGNEIDFEPLKGTHGLFSPNASGKTAAFDALMFCLFDKTPRAFKASHIVNNRKNSFACQLIFNVNGEDFGIRRVGSRKSNGDMKVDVDFWKYENGKEVSLNAEDRRATNAVIRRYVGSYDDFILTNLSVQNMNSIFIDKGQSERKDLLGQFMGINIFDALYNIAIDEMKEAAGALKILSKDDSATVLATAQTQIEELTNEYQLNETQLKAKETEVDALSAEIGKLYESKVPLNVSSTNIKGLEAKQKKLVVALSELSERRITLNESSTQLTAQSGSMASDVTAYAAQDIETAYNTYLAVRSKDQEIDREVKLLTKQIETDQSRLDHITTHDFDPNCSFCVKNNQTLARTADQIRKELATNRKRKVVLTETQQTHAGVLASGIELTTDYTEWSKLSKELTQVDRELLVLRAELSDVDSAIAQQKTQLKDTEDAIREYHESVDLIEKNNEIDNKIATLEQQKKEISADIRSLETKLRGLHGRLQVQKSNKTKILRQIKDMEELEQTIGAYEFYVDAIKRDGIPYELISKVIPSIEAEMNNILSQIVDFTIALEIDGKNINGRIIYDDDRHWPLEMSSGMERFISGLAIRAALINISNLPKPNFLIIDEGLSVLSSENLVAMHQLFEILKDQFEFIVVISHLDVVRDMADHLMEIQLGADGYSKITY